MPSITELGAKPASPTNSVDSSRNSGNGEGKNKKKKRPRQRNRIRNKNYVPPPNPATAVVGNIITQTEAVKPVKQIKIKQAEPKLPAGTKENKLQAKTAATPMKPAATPMKPAGMPNATPPGNESSITLTPTNAEAGGKTREQIVAEREAKKLAKQAKKTSVGDVKATTTTATSVSKTALNTAATVADKPTLAKITGANVAASPVSAAEKTREQIKAEREAKKAAKHAAKVSKADGVAVVTEQLEHMHIAESGAGNVTAVGKPPPAASLESEEKKKPVLTKAERRAIQEAQRAAKAHGQAQKSAPPGIQKKATVKPAKALASVATPAKPAMALTRSTTSPTKSPKSNDCKVRLFNHLESAHPNSSLFVNNAQIHPSIARLGEQYAKRTIVGSNARCIAFLNALKTVIQDFETPPKKEFSRSLEATFKHAVEHLQLCRPLAVSVSNAFKHIKHVLTQLPTDQPETELKQNLCHFIETYIENQIEKAAQAISSSMQEKITNGDVILTFGCSSLISYICEEAKLRRVNFRVIVVDSRPFCEGQELLRRLTTKEIPCSYVLINAIGYVMPEATKVLLGAHALLSNGYVMARTGTAQVALVAHSYNVPVLVCCETHKFSERFQTDAIVYNELGNPDDLIISNKCCLTNWQAKHKMSPLNLMYDITPPELVTAVVTEVSILPCTSVPVILRIKPTEIGYYS